MVLACVHLISPSVLPSVSLSIPFFSRKCVTISNYLKIACWDLNCILVCYYHILNIYIWTGVCISQLFLGVSEITLNAKFNPSKPHVTRFIARTYIIHYDDEPVVVIHLRENMMMSQCGWLSIRGSKCDVQKS